MKRAQDIFAGLREGWLTLKVDHIFLLEQAVEAHSLLESRKSMGKVILKVEAG